MDDSVIEALIKIPEQELVTTLRLRHCIALLDQFHADGGGSLYLTLTELEPLLKDAVQIQCGGFEALRKSSLKNLAQRSACFLTETRYSDLPELQKLVHILVLLADCLTFDQKRKILAAVLEVDCECRCFVELIYNAELNADLLLMFSDIVDLILSCYEPDVCCDSHCEILWNCVAYVLHRAFETNSLLWSIKLVSCLTERLVEGASWPLLTNPGTLILLNKLRYFSAWSPCARVRSLPVPDMTIGEQSLYFCTVVHILVRRNCLGVLSDETVDLVVQMLRRGLVCDDATVRKHCRATVTVLYAQRQVHTPFSVGRKWPDFLTLLETLDSQQVNVLSENKRGKSEITSFKFDTLRRFFPVYNRS
ncbi:unnamed protein product [Soboliphyme baturini]|uniref:DUF2013 domain-containing protein n=1 Tax=Soboliphyme baturini TaxID=241478 RepID=A0A183J533_9BILA|nr:unnamed protein product [Soboliphyme baturini]